MVFMKIDIDLKNMLETAAKRVVIEATRIAPEAKDGFGGGLRQSIQHDDFDPVDNSINVFSDPQQLTRKNIKPWHGKYYPELVHMGTKFMAARPFFEQTIERVDISDLGVDFIINYTDWQE